MIIENIFEFIRAKTNKFRSFQGENHTDFLKLSGTASLFIFVKTRELYEIKSGFPS